MREYERRLPHWDVAGEPMFVTFRLYGSLPANRTFPPARLSAGEAFVAMDRLLDNAREGTFFLKHPEIASMVVQAIHDGEARFNRYSLHAFVVMPNHVHMLVTPAVAAADWLRSLNGFTGLQANRLLNRTGYFWQNESYDHLVRNDTEFERIRRYIEWNPVKAGFVFAPQDFLWSSASPGGSPAAGQKP